MYTALDLALADQMMLAFRDAVRMDTYDRDLNNPILITTLASRAAQVIAAHAWLHNVNTPGARDDFMEKFNRYMEVAPARLRDEHLRMTVELAIAEANGAALTVGEVES